MMGGICAEGGTDKKDRRNGLSVPRLDAKDEILGWKKKKKVAGDLSWGRGVGQCEDGRQN